jgi:TolB-like protein
MFHQYPQRLRLPVCSTLPHGVLPWILVSVLLLAATHGFGQQSDLKQVAVSLARDINAGNRHTITVADFTDLQGNVTELGRFISEELSSQLVLDAKSFTVVERIQLAAILKEHQISISGLVDPATIKKLGQFAGVDAIVTGTLVPFSDSVRLTAKVLDVSTAKMMAVSTADMPRTKAIDDLLSRGITRPATDDQGGPSPPVAPPGSQLRSVLQDEFLITLRSCAKRGDRIACSGTVTNKAAKARVFGIGRGGDWTEAVDNLGNTYASDQTHVGQPDGWERLNVIPELPVNFFFSFPRLDPAATQISVVFAYYGDGINRSKILFRNIPLTQK